MKKQVKGMYVLSKDDDNRILADVRYDIELKPYAIHIFQESNKIGKNGEWQGHNAMFLNFEELRNLFNIPEFQKTKPSRRTEKINKITKTQILELLESIKANVRSMESSSKHPKTSAHYLGIYYKCNQINKLLEDSEE